MSSDLFFQNWAGPLRTLVVGVLAYLALVLLLRISGKRTLSKMNAFDLVVTVALGSTLATILLSKDVALVEGLTALGLLIGLQFIIAWLSVRSPLVGKLVKSEPRLLVYQGTLLHDAMRAERVVAAEIEAAVREQGQGGLGEVAAVVLETDGSFTIIPQRDGQLLHVLQGVKGPQRQEKARS
ncbi:MAG: DUF421 domain-containing protein [Chloroflexaceae bacterium]|nr:DUF421 domain-containing protein [Chloroflexaceae bacterium]